MDVDTLLTAGAVVLVTVFIYVLLHRNKVKKVMQHNNAVPPLLLQRSTQLKLSRLQEATANNETGRKQLERLVSEYQSRKIGIKTYNDKLDLLINKLNVDL